MCIILDEYGITNAPFILPNTSVHSCTHVAAYLRGKQCLPKHMHIRSPLQPCPLSYMKFLSFLSSLCVEFSLFEFLTMPKPTGHTKDKGSIKGKQPAVFPDSIPSHTLHLESSQQPFVHTPLLSGSHSQPLALSLLFRKIGILKSL